jgi:UDP-N-acetylmuramoyl-tripeptide--D-alanyl-D-alanine ligase
MPKPFLSEILHQLCIEDAPKKDLQISGVALDSRHVNEGALFVAINGKKVDGHDFVFEAEKNGAACALVRQGYVNSAVSIPMIHVDDPVEALQILAQEHIAKTKAKIVAVTGSIGKTTTKDFLYSILKTKYKTACTSGNQNSQVGMATSLLNNIEGDEEVIIAEMGMTEAGQIQKLTKIAPPDIAIVTYIDLVHAHNFDSLEEIAKAKSEIFSHKKTEMAIVNYDSPYAKVLLENAACKKITYSTTSLQADVKMQVEDELLRLFEKGKETKLPFVSLIAPHLYGNCLAACIAAKNCGMTWEEIGNSFATLKQSSLRMQLEERNGIRFVNDSYNASEASMKEALNYMKRRHVVGKKIAVIGQIRELGKFSNPCHVRIGEHALSCVDKVYCLGEECAPIVSMWKDKERPVEWFTSFEELVLKLKDELHPGDLVLLKGSNSNGLWRVLEAFS